MLISDLYRMYPVHIAMTVNLAFLLVQERRDGGTDRGIAGRGDNYFLHGLIAKSACLLERVHAYSHAL